MFTPNGLQEDVFALNLACNRFVDSAGLNKTIMIKKLSHRFTTVQLNKFLLIDGNYNICLIY